MANFDVDFWEDDYHSQLTLTQGFKVVFSLQGKELADAIDDGLIDLDRLLESCIWYAKHLTLI